MSLEFPYYVRLHKDLPNWGRLVGRLATPAFTSGEVEAIVRISGKVLGDWEKAEVFQTFHRGQAIPRRNRKAGGWRMFSVYDIWTLAILKNLRDWGTWLEKLRPAGGRPTSGSGGLLGGSVPAYLYNATFYWVYRNPVFLSIGEKFVGFTPAVRDGERLPDGRYFWKAEFYDDPTKQQFHVIRLLPLMDNVASALSRPDFKIILTPVDVLEATHQAAPKAVLPEMWELHVQFVLDGERLHLEPLGEEK